MIAETGDEDPAASTAGDRLSDLFRPTIKICHQHRRRLLPARAAGHQQGKIIGQVQGRATGLQASVQNADSCVAHIPGATRPRENFQNLSPFYIPSSFILAQNEEARLPCCVVTWRGKVEFNFIYDVESSHLRCRGWSNLTTQIGRPAVIRWTFSGSAYFAGW